MIHPSAEVAAEARIGQGTKVWHQAQVREGAVIGDNCTLGKGVYVDRGVRVGNNVKIENNAQLFHGATIEEGVFIGPGAILTNDKYPRSITPKGMLKTADDWSAGEVLVKYGASIGAGAIILPDVTIGRWALVAAAAIVAIDVADQALVAGNPARQIGYVCQCGHRLRETVAGEWACPSCASTYRLFSQGTAS